MTPSIFQKCLSVILNNKHFLKKETVAIIPNDPLMQDVYARFTMVPL